MASPACSSDRRLPRSVLVTGATGGLGQAIARHLTACGSEVVLGGRDPQRLAQLQAEGVGARIAVADLAAPEGSDALVGAAVDVDAVVLNAGLNVVARLADRTPAGVADELAVNLVTPAVVAARLLAAWRERGHGSLVFVSSLAAKNWRPHLATYAASKAGVRALAWSLRQEHDPADIHVGLVTPGPIREAGMFAAAAPQASWWPSRSPDDVARAVERSLVHRVGEVTVAPAVLRAWAALAAATPRGNAAVNRLLRMDALVERHATGGTTSDRP